MAILITGGARSGKSGFAEQYAMRSGPKGIYIATCQPYDEEMTDRIGKHRLDRDGSGFPWETFEEPYAADGLLGQLGSRVAQNKREGIEPPVILLDCLTLWLTNWLLRIEHESFEASRLHEETDSLLAAIREFPVPGKLLIVTNEVGDGIVPAYPLGRRFRDEAGRLNQQAASICDRVFLVTAGIPVELKSQAFSWDQL
ncbi:bifunctional adenosylcobinamide kinase/adenosylcobinamide-phosphate guanylyltransferase [Paenibacillus harenae]|uniref:bifunctional adenosylcobinamide kinase/adenosylcobinamide-phosphate guanylyltransferase n=1 Tax=Paenibacillus harenae TaxID=306543 RepID=UPI00040A6D5E|nr:bifunctional adenosylcobinamide kinase/adenosylcobinamide-phosphate guanylyltransferase [Paenibacillus harenae]